MTDFALESTFDTKFTTRQFTTGAPFTLAGTPVISAYPDNSTTQLTAGITLTADFDGVTGLNNIRVVATAANGYAAGSSYALVITTGTVDSVSVVGEVVGAFTLERGAAFGRLGAPAGASVSADVAAVKVDTAAILVDTGTTLQAELDGIQADTEDIQAKIGTPAVDLAADILVIDNFLDTEIADILADTGTTLQAELDGIQADTEDIQARLPAALVGGRIDANISAINSATGGVSALDRSTRTMVEGTVGAASSTTSIVTSSLAPAAAVADQFKGRIVIFDEDTTTANLRGQATDITANTSLGVLTVTALTTAPASGDTFIIV